MFAYEQSFLCLAYHCDIWCEGASYLYTQSKLFPQVMDTTEQALNLKKNAEKEAGDLYERAINMFMKNNILIYLVYAELEEVRFSFYKVNLAEFW